MLYLNTSQTRKCDNCTKKNKTKEKPDCLNKFSFFFDSKEIFKIKLEFAFGSGFGEYFREKCPIALLFYGLNGLTERL